MGNKWSTGQKTGVIVGSIFAGILLLTVFCIDVLRLASYCFYIENDYPTARYRQEEPYAYRGDSDGSDGYDFDDYGDYGSYGYDDYGYGNGYYDGYGDYDSEESDSGEYYEFHDAIRNDLFYQIDFEYYGEVFGDDNVELSMAYPVIYGKENSSIDAESVNRVIQREVGEIKEYVASVGEELSSDVYFRFDVDCYVTYMDEEILSIIYVESGYLDGDSYENYVISVNVDMKSGLAMTNSQILDIDDEFSIDFRNRSERQNGDVGEISMFSDQDITEMLTDDNSLIIFYTPLGMEVGFNYYYGWVTVTYKDYQKYESLF